MVFIFNIQLKFIIYDFGKKICKKIFNIFKKQKKIKSKI